MWAISEIGSSHHEGLGNKPDAALSRIKTATGDRVYWRLGRVQRLAMHLPECGGWPASRWHHRCRPHATKA